jgi:CheY-like chemotaxis protein
LRLEVWDTGLGIPHSKRTVIFREFQRLDQGAKVARGLGLGLSIVERIGRVLDAPVELRSEPGRGSVFSVEVPLAPVAKPAAPARGRPRAPAAPLQGLRVLAIDNEPAILDGMRGLLARWGCKVATAGSTAEALRQSEPPEVVVADYHLDEENGLDVIRALRRRFGTEIPAILLTADRSPSLRDEAGALGVPVLNKPLKPAALRALLAQWRATRIAAE